MLLDLGRSDPCAAARADICSRGSAGECHLALSSRCPTTECLLAHCSAVYPDSTLAACAATVNRNPIVSVDHETEGRRAFRLREAGSGFDAEAVTMSTPWPPRHRERRLSAGGSGAGDGLHRRPEPAPRQTRPDYRSRQWLCSRLRPSMRQVHRAGEKSFIDFSGKRPSLVDRRTGELRHVELFVAVLGASSFTYAEATETQQLPDWVNAHVRMVEYFGGAATLWVPDQLKSAITRPCRYEPGVNRTYEDLAAHYGAVVVPARPRKPRGQGCCRELCARGPAVDTGPAPRPDLLRARPAERRDPRPARRAQRPADEEAGRQPPRPLRAARRPGATAPADHALRIDYHVEVERHAYSVPYQLIREQVEVRYTTNTVEIFHRGKRVASHRRRYDRRPSTEAEHTSANGSNPARMTNWSYWPDLGVHRGRDGAFRGIARRHGDSEALERGHRRAPVPPEGPSSGPGTPRTRSSSRLSRTRISGSRRPDAGCRPPSWFLPPGRPPGSRSC